MPKTYAFEKNVKAEGGEWFAFDQTKDFIKSHTFGSNGVCAPLSIVFLGRAACGDFAFKTYVISGDGEEDVMNLKYRQHTASGYENSYLEDFGLQLDYERKESSLTVCEMVKNNKGYYFIGMSNIPETWDGTSLPEGAEGHAVVVINEPRDEKSTCCFFDPNFGEFYFPSMDNLSNFLKKYWKHYYKEMSSGSATIKCYSKKARR